MLYSIYSFCVFKHYLIHRLCVLVLNISILCSFRLFCSVYNYFFGFHWNINKFIINLTLNRVIIFMLKITTHHKSVARKFLKTHFFFLPFYVRFLYALNLLTLIVFHKNETKCCRSIHWYLFYYLPF